MRVPLSKYSYAFKLVPQYILTVYIYPANLVINYFKVFSFEHFFPWVGFTAMRKRLFFSPKLIICLFFHIFRLDNPNKWSREFNDFLKKCLVKDPNQRLTADQLMKVQVHSGVFRNIEGGGAEPAANR